MCTFICISIHTYLPIISMPVYTYHEIHPHLLLQALKTTLLVWPLGTEEGEEAGDAPLLQVYMHRHFDLDLDRSI